MVRILEVCSMPVFSVARSAAASKSIVAPVTRLRRGTRVRSRILRMKKTTTGFHVVGISTDISVIVLAARRPGFTRFHPIRQALPRLTRDSIIQEKMKFQGIFDMGKSSHREPKESFISIVVRKLPYLFGVASAGKTFFPLAYSLYSR
jgi:hypothetical protein